MPKVKIKKFTRKQLLIQAKAADVQRVKWGSKSPPKPGAWKAKPSKGKK